MLLTVDVLGQKVDVVVVDVVKLDVLEIVQMEWGDPIFHTAFGNFTSFQTRLQRKTMPEFGGLFSKYGCNLKINVSN